MKTDIPLKRLFERHARDLLVLTGDQGARVKEARTVELHEMRRTADVVLKLERKGEVYYRHIEFQGKND